MHWGACAKAGSDGYFGRMPGRRDCGEGSGRRLLCPACRRPRPWSCKDRQTDRQASKMAVGDHRPARGRKRKKTPLFHFPTRYDDGTDHLAGGIGRPRTRPRLASGPVTAGRPYSCLPGKSRHRGHGQILQPRLGLSHRLSFPRPLCTDAWCQSRRPWPRTTSCRGYPRSLLQWYFSFLFFLGSLSLSHTHTHTVGIPVFGPSLLAARMEGSKAFAKDFMSRHNIPTANYTTFTADQFHAASNYIQSCPYPLVLKASGLAAGKGVLLPQSTDEALAGLEDIMINQAFGSAGSSPVHLPSFHSSSQAARSSLKNTSKAPNFPSLLSQMATLSSPFPPHKTTNVSAKAIPVPTQGVWVPMLPHLSLLLKSYPAS